MLDPSIFPIFYTFEDNYYTLFIPLQNECFVGGGGGGGILESLCLLAHLSMCLAVYPSVYNNTSFSQSTGRGIKSLLLTALVLLFTTQSRLLMILKNKHLKTLWEKEKMLVSSILSFSNNVFYPSQNNFEISRHIYFVVCKCFQFGPV